MINKKAMIVWVVMAAAWSSVTLADNSMRSANSDGQNLTENVGVWYVTTRNRKTQRSAGDIYGGRRGEPRMGACSESVSHTGKNSCRNGETGSSGWRIS